MLVRPAFFQPEESRTLPALTASFCITLRYTLPDDAEHVFSVLPRSLAELDMLGLVAILATSVRGTATGQPHRLAANAEYRRLRSSSVARNLPRLHHSHGTRIALIRYTP